MKHRKENEAGFRIELEKILRSDPFQPSPAQLDLFEQHWSLILAWNERVNLTAIIDPKRSAWLHYLDSLQALPHLIGTQVLDIGSGAGFPGIVLAIAQPETSFTLMEPRRKRASFLTTCVARLGIGNVDVIQAKSTDEPTFRFDSVVSRATFSDYSSLSSCFSWLRPGGRLVRFCVPADFSGQGQQVEYELMGQARALEIFEPG